MTQRAAPSVSSSESCMHSPLSHQIGLFLTLCLFISFINNLSFPRFTCVCFASSSVIFLNTTRAFVSLPFSMPTTLNPTSTVSPTCSFCSGSSAPAPVYPSTVTVTSSGSSNEPSHVNSNMNISTISTLPIPTISSIPVNTIPMITAAAPLSPASLASAIDVDNDNDAENVVQAGETQVLAPSSLSYSHSRTGHDIVNEPRIKSHPHDSRRLQCQRLG
ncbi:hypothetical protein EV361DRAFT_966928 [Lentinula raphanica]|nr:hypothetical protein EV361DRAFT_966928 [Lentinula raphanica]